MTEPTDRHLSVAPEPHFYAAVTKIGNVLEGQGLTWQMSPKTQAVIEEALALGIEPVEISWQARSLKSAKSVDAVLRSKLVTLCALPPSAREFPPDEPVPFRVPPHKYQGIPGTDVCAWCALPASNRHHDVAVSS